MKISWSGQHTNGKALQILFASLPDSDTVDVVGWGRKTSSWQCLARKMGIENRITWHGWLSRENAQAVVSQSDVFVITSVRDLTSTVLLEALSFGKPVVCIDHCGFSDVVDPSCGIKVKVGTPDDVICGFKTALLRLKDEEYRRELSAGAIRRAKEYSWDNKRGVLARIYRPEWRKILVSVYACSPSRGSEAGMGWNYLRIIAQDRKIWAIVEKEKWEKEIRNYLSAHPDEMKNVHFTFIHKPRCRWLRKIWPPSYYWFYKVWQRRAYKVAKHLHAEVGFDAVHQLNMVGYREPGFLWKMPIPFIWGPIGGLDLTEWRLFGLLDYSGKVEFMLRNIINYLHRYFLVRPRLAARRAATHKALICATKGNQILAKKIWNVESMIMCEIGT